MGSLLEARATHPGRTRGAHLRALAQTHGISGRRVGEYSLGMGQRLGIAAALLSDPAPGRAAERARPGRRPLDPHAPPQARWRGPHGLPLLAPDEPSGLKDAVLPYLPSNAGEAILNAHQNATSLAPWTGLALFAGYTAVLLATAAILLPRRDA